MIIGQDLRYENGRVITDQTKEAKQIKHLVLDHVKIKPLLIC